MIDLEILREILSGVKTEHKNSLEASSVINEVWKEVLEYSEQPRKRGKWILGDIETGACDIQYQCKICSECGWESSLIIPRNFCPNCGADMRGDSK